jgi:hypothetical protein
MQKVISISLVNRRLVAIVTATALIAALLLAQAFSQRGVAVKARLAAGTPCTAALLYVPQYPRQYGFENLQLSATSTNCLNPEYKFWRMAPGTSTWVAMGGYSTQSTARLGMSIGTKTGTWQFAVWARQSGSTAKYEAWSIATHNIISSYCRGAIIGASVYSPQPPGTAVTITAADNECLDPYFEFWELAPGSSTWSRLRGYTASINGAGGDTFVWDSTGFAKGAYRFMARARQAASLNRYDSYAILTFWLT